MVSATKIIFKVSIPRLPLELFFHKSGFEIIRSILNSLFKVLAPDLVPYLETGANSAENIKENISVNLQLFSRGNVERKRSHTFCSNSTGAIYY